MKKARKHKLNPIPGRVGYFGSYNSGMRSALCPIESPYRDITLDTGETYRWWGEKSHSVPSDTKVFVYAWATPERTLRRVFCSWKDHNGYMHSTGMQKADKSLVAMLFKNKGGKS